MVEQKPTEKEQLLRELEALAQRAESISPAVSLGIRTTMSAVTVGQEQEWIYACLRFAADDTSLSYDPPRRVAKRRLTKPRVEK